jgi:hypothetical protein
MCSCDTCFCVVIAELGVCLAELGVLFLLYWVCLWCALASSALYVAFVSVSCTYGLKITGYSETHLTIQIQKWDIFLEALSRS